MNNFEEGQQGNLQGEEKHKAGEETPLFHRSVRENPTNQACWWHGDFISCSKPFWSRRVPGLPAEALPVLPETPEGSEASEVLPQDPKPTGL